VNGKSKKYKAHECKASGCNEVTTKRFYCSLECQQRVQRNKSKSRRAEEKALKPKKYCVLCNAELAPQRGVYCNDKCAEIGTNKKLQEGREIAKEKLKKIREKLNA